MKFIIFVSLFSFNLMASELEPSFSVKKIISNRADFRSFVQSGLMINELESRDEASELIAKYGSSFPGGRIFKDEPLATELVYQLSKSPDSLVGPFEIFIERVKLVKFFAFLVGTFFISHLLGEVKFFFGILSPMRVGFSVLRFCSVNALRLSGFVYFFKDNFNDLANVYLISINNVAEQYPLLLKASHLMNNLLSSFVG